MNSDNLKPVKHVEIRKDMKVSELVGEMRDTGFGAKKLAQANEVFKQMIEDEDCKKFFGLAGAMVPAGMKRIIVDFLKKGYIDVFVSTGANLTHDLIEALGEKHYQGNENADDAELNNKGIDRIYDVFMKAEVYKKLEDFFERNWEELGKAKSIRDFLWKIGGLVQDENSILRVCYENKIPIFCPAVADSGIGLMVWGRKILGKNISIDAFEDMKEIIDISWTCKKSGVFYIGGGTSKNFIQQALQFSKGADYGIQITTDRPEFGGSSGANLKEGISWGKMNKQARFVNVHCDATIALPILAASIF